MTIADATLDVGGFPDVEDSLSLVKKSINACAGGDGFKVSAEWITIIKG